MTKKIVCAVDNTDHSKAAVAVASELAKACGAELTLLAINELVGGIGRMGGPVAYRWDKAELKKVVDGATEEAKKAGIADPNVVSANSRDIARAIVIYAEDTGADHIVVGTGGKGSISRLVLGSVSRDVVARAHCPVTVAR